MHRTLATVLVVLLCLVHIETTSAQSTNASVGGFVQDPSQAFIPGVTVTATNTQTGVVTTAVTNESGAYNITALLPGTYKLTAELPGFKTQVISDVQLGQAAVQRINFTLQVGAADRNRRSHSGSDSADYGVIVDDRKCPHREERQRPSAGDQQRSRSDARRWRACVARISPRIRLLLASAHQWSIPSAMG